MALPGDLSVILVTGSYEAIDGTPASGGSVTFNPSDVITDSTGKVIFGRSATAGVADGQLTTNGQPGITLPCTDNATLIPSGFSYTVTEAITDWPKRSYKIQLPSSLGSTVDLSQLSANGGGGAGVSSVNGKSGAVTLTASDVGAATLDGSGQVPASELGNVPPQYQPYQFRPESYGAHGDGEIVSDVAVNGTQTFTSSNMAANAAVGQWVMINGGRGTSDNAAIGQITAIAGSSITINSPASTLAINATATGLNAVYGTDDTAAINAAVSAAKAYAEAHEYFAEILFSDSIYVVAGLTQSNDGTALYNTQIPVPYPTNPNGRKLVIAFTGAGRVDHMEYWNGTVPALAGTSIVSMQVAPATLDATFGAQSVIGAPTPEAGMAGATSPAFVNHKPVVTNIQVVASVYTNMTGFDFTFSSGVYVDGCSVIAFAQPLEGAGPLLSHIWNTGTVFNSRLGTALRLPTAGNNADVHVPSFESTGITVGIRAVSEHVLIGYLRVTYAGVAIQLDNSSSGHGMTIGHVTAEAYAGGIQYKTGASGGKSVLNIGSWSTENSGSAYDVSDPGNSLYGQLNWYDTLDTTHAAPVVNGAANLRITNQRQARGAWSAAPAVPASGTAQQNTAWRDATVYVSGTVTGITIDSTAIPGVSSGTPATNPVIRVPSGHTVTLAYSSAPTWAWLLD